MRLTVLGECGAWPEAGGVRQPRPFPRTGPFTAQTRLLPHWTRNAGSGSRRAAPYLTSARQAGRQARRAGAGRLLLTHLWPGSDRSAAAAEALAEHSGEIGVAAGGLVVDLG